MQTTGARQTDSKPSPAIQLPAPWLDAPEALSTPALRAAADEAAAMVRAMWPLWTGPTPAPGPERVFRALAALADQVAREIFHAREQRWLASLSGDRRRAALAAIDAMSSTVGT